MQTHKNLNMCGKIQRAQVKKLLDSTDFKWACTLSWYFQIKLHGAMRSQIKVGVRVVFSVINTGAQFHRILLYGVSKSYWPK